MVVVYSTGKDDEPKANPFGIGDDILEIGYLSLSISVPRIQENRWNEKAHGKQKNHILRHPVAEDQNEKHKAHEIRGRHAQGTTRYENVT
eukprot:1393115-Amorphochlora_amoeboformis.AAC.1